MLALVFVVVDVVVAVVVVSIDVCVSLILLSDIYSPCRSNCAELVTESFRLPSIFLFL